MKKIITIAVSVLLLVTAGYLLLIDLAVRKQLYSTHSHGEDLGIFEAADTPAAQKELYIQNFGNPLYAFPRREAARIEVVRNKFLSRTRSASLPQVHHAKIISFFNDPANFTWSDTSWEAEDSEYIFKFFDKANHQIGKAWICIDRCEVTHTVPFSPNMKYGGLSPIGKKKFTMLLNTILPE